MARRIDGQGNFIDSNDADNSFDLMPFWNGFYAQDKSVVVGTYRALLDACKQLYAALTAKQAGITG
jgi:hypothetical protein